jgi:hypothetical protein
MELSYEALKKTVQGTGTAKAKIQKLWDFYRNDVARPPYFPYLHEETTAEYQKRTKIAVGWLGSISNRIASYFCKPPITIRFSVDGKDDAAKAKEAAELWERIAKENSYDSFRVDVVRDAGVGGNGYTKERFVAYDHETGEEIRDTSGGRTWIGSVKIDRVSEVFVYRARDGDRTIYIEAWLYQDGKYKLLSAGVESKPGDIEYIELIAPSYYNEQSGELEKGSIRRIWKSGEPMFDNPIEYTFAPIQRWANMVSRPEVEDGISDIEWVTPLTDAGNHIISGQVRSIEYHGWPRTVISGVADEGDIINRPEKTSYLPEGATVDTVTWNQDLAGSHSLNDRLVDFMSAITGVPKHMLHDLEGAGQVASGIALRIMYRNLEEACRLKEAGFKSADEAVIRTSLDIISVHNDRKGYFDEVDIQAIYNVDRTPKDQDKDRTEDQKELALGVINVVDYIMKHKPVGDRKEALNWLFVRAEEKALLRDMLKEFQFTPEMIDSVYSGGFKVTKEKAGESKEVQEEESPPAAEAAAEGEE